MAGVFNKWELRPPVEIVSTLEVTSSYERDISRETRGMYTCGKTTQAEILYGIVTR